jgi:hypothetical protein
MMRCLPSELHDRRVLIASLEVTSGWGAVLSIIVLGTLALVWLVALFLVLVDTMSVGAKILWILFLIVLAPVALPAYFLVRHHVRASR